MTISVAAMFSSLISPRNTSEVQRLVYLTILPHLGEFLRIVLPMRLATCLSLGEDCPQASDAPGSKDLNQLSFGKEPDQELPRINLRARVSIMR